MLTVGNCLGQAFVNGKLQPFIFPLTIKPASGMVEDQSVHNKVHAFHGDLIEGKPTLVHFHFLPDEYFNLATQVQVPTLMSAKTLLAADAAITSFGSFVAGNPDTTPARTRKACVLPVKYVGYLLSTVS